MNEEMKRFQDDLLESVEQMKRGNSARSTEVELPPVAAARASVEMTQPEFAALLGVSPDAAGLGTGTAAAVRCSENAASGSSQASGGSSRARVTA